MNNLINNTVLAHESFLNHNHQYDNAQSLAVVILLALGVIAYLRKKKSIYFN